MRIDNKRAALAAGLAAAALAWPAAAQQGDTAIPRASAYQQVTSLPDWSGVWNPDWAALFEGDDGRRPAEPQLTPAAQERFDAFTAAQAEGRNVQTDAANCIPPGMPSIMRAPYPIEFVYSPGRVTIFAETYSQARRIYTDGRDLPEDPDLLFNGSSVGHWEGDTLVVDTIGFSPQTSIAEGIPHGPNMRIQERFWLEEPDRMIVETTVTDPDVLTEPYVTRLAFDRMDGWEMREYVCAENNRDAADAEGRASMDLGLDDVDDPFGPLPPEQ